MAARNLEDGNSRKRRGPLTEIPIKYQAASSVGIIPEVPGHENLPPVQSAAYSLATPTSLPKISFQQIYHMMILRHTEEGKEVNNFKGLDRAVKHFEAGDISQIMTAQIDDSVDYVRAICLASMKKMKYKVFLCIEEKTKVHFAYCECPVGLAQTCSHIGGLLFHLHHLHLTEVLKSESATSKICQWNVPRPMKMDPKPLKEWNLGRPKISAEGELQYRERKQINFDPRHPEERAFNQMNALKQLQTLKSLFPKTRVGREIPVLGITGGMIHLWTIPDDTPDVVMEEEVRTLEDPMETAMNGLILSAENLPMPVSIDDSLSLFIEQRTRGQRKCQIWKELHKGRITSSLFGAVLTSGPSPTSLIKQVIHGSSLDRYPTLPVPVRWGVEHEQNALVDYLALQNAVTSLRVEESGLTIYPSHAFLGATSDGWVYDESMPEGNQKGVLEIKCPYSISNDVITHREVHELVGRKGFCLEESENGPRLMRDHSYYAQIQGEMAIMGCAWGDFVVWTAAEQSNCFVERIYFDPDFCSFMLPKLVEWFISNISPSYIKS